MTVENSAWEVALQTIDTAWSDDRVFENDLVDLEVESNRANFLIEVSADGLEFDELESMFDSDDFTDDHDARADDDVIVLQAGNDVDLPVSFTRIDRGVYKLEIEVVDADATATAEIRVGEPRATPTEATPEPTSTPAQTPTAPPETPTGTTEPATAETTGAETIGTEKTEVETTEIPPTTTPGQSGFGGLAMTLAVFAAIILSVRRFA